MNRLPKWVVITIVGYSFLLILAFFILVLNPMIDSLTWLNGALPKAFRLF